MAATINPAAPHHLPPFITAPGETDYFYNGSVIFLIALVIILGALYFRLHALPEHLAHGNADKQQFQLIGVLALLALFTHNNIFWVAALLLALIRIPDLATPLSDMAQSLAKMVRRGRTFADEGAATETTVPPEEHQHHASPAVAVLEAEPHGKKRQAVTETATTVGGPAAHSAADAPPKGEAGGTDTTDAFKRART